MNFRADMYSLAGIFCTWLRRVLDSSCVAERIFVVVPLAWLVLARSSNNWSSSLRGMANSSAISESGQEM